MGVASPRNERDVVGLVEWARSQGVPLVSRGAGTGMPGGNIGRGVVVDMSSHFRRLGPINTATRTIRAGVGVTLAEVDDAARSEGLFLPPLPSSAQRCSVGGAVASNAAGARTFGYGSIRDWVDSVTVVLGTGAVLRLKRGEEVVEPFRALARRLMDSSESILGSWPQVRKNSSGYALDRFLADSDPLQLLIGSEGTLGLITEVELRLSPVPEHVALSMVGCRTLEDVGRLAGLGAQLGASACEFFGRRLVELNPAGTEFGFVDESAEGLVMIEVSGSADQTRAARDHVTTLARELEAQIHWAESSDDRDKIWAFRKGASPAIAAAAARGAVSTQFIEDSVVPVEQLAAYVRGVDHILDDVDFDRVVFGHAGDGNIHVNPLVPVNEPDTRQRVREALERTVDLVAALGGTLSGEHGDGRLRAPLLERVWSSSTVSGFRFVKEALDPDGVLNPGVILPVEGQDPLDGLWGFDAPGSPKAV